MCMMEVIGFTAADTKALHILTLRTQGTCTLAG